MEFSKYEIKLIHCIDQRHQNINQAKKIQATLMDSSYQPMVKDLAELNNAKTRAKWFEDEIVNTRLELILIDEGIDIDNLVD